MRHIDEVVKKIADKVSDKLTDIDDLDYELDEGDIYDATVRAKFKFGNCEIDSTYYYRHNEDTVIEVLIYPANDKHNLERLEEAVNKYVNDNFEFDDMYDNIMDKVREDSEDEWQRHGFRDAADYYQYRYG